jgi:cation:H+ antiporter
MDYIIFVISMVALVYGSNFVINESEKIALHFNISHYVIGATLIALGTSLPEMAASVSASFHHKSDMAVANVLGSVIFNIALVLGLVFIVSKKINPKRDLFAKDSAWALFPVLIFILMAYDGVISRFEGILFLTMMGGYLMFLSQDATALAEEIDEELAKEKFEWIKSISLLLIGFTFIIVGAQYTIESASNIARSLGVSEWVIGLLLIAFGTSLPELAVSVVAARRGNGDMAVGNIIGSNVANFTVVLGLASLANPLSIDLQHSLFDIIAALIATFMIVFITANRLYNRSAGIALLALIGIVVANALNF